MTENIQAYKTARVGAYSLEYRADLEPDKILAALAEPGTVLKMASRTVTRRVGDWVVKSPRPSLASMFRHTFMPAQSRRPWAAAVFLHENAVPIPEPVAFARRTFCGVVISVAVVSRYLDGCRNVEHYAKELLRRDRADLGPFLLRIADAVSRLTATGAYHSDLSGKNIFTANGSDFYFIDLDAVHLQTLYTEDLRFKNHVQLYDSFCDFADDSLLAPFLSRMLPDQYRVREWAPRVKEAQQKRRAAQIEIWKKQGKWPRSDEESP